MPVEAVGTVEGEQTEATAATIAATRLMNITGCRIIRDGEQLLVGVWSDLDGLDIRAAIRGLGMQSLRVVHLESSDVPVDYKVRHCPDKDRGESFRIWLQRAEIMFERKRGR